MEMKKNLWVIPTDKPSRLYKSKITQNILIGNISQHGDATYNVNIYITSDEEIKEGTKPCWCIDTKDNFINYYQGALPLYNYIGYKKIILTTDQELIKDGVQAIDDEFLEWFVKNPNCESVEFAMKWGGNSTMFGFGMGNVSSDGEFIYKIIIPKKELNMIECYFTPRKDTSSATICSNCGQEKFLHTIGEGIKVSTYIVNAKEEPNKTHYLDELPNMDREVLAKMWESAMPKLEPKQETLEQIDQNNPITRGSTALVYKQETLEEAMILNGYHDKESDDLWREGVEFGAKWQQEQDKNKYSEEELKQAFIDGSNNPIEEDDSYGTEFNKYMDEWFEQFKKK